MFKVLHRDKTTLSGASSLEYIFIFGQESIFELCLGTQMLLEMSRFVVLVVAKWSGTPGFDR